MPLGLARDSMLDLAEMAKKVDDGEFKTSIEITQAGSDNLINISPRKEGMEYHHSAPKQQPQHGSCSSTSHETPNTPTDRETKTPDPCDTAVHDEDERSSIANSSIDSDVAPRSTATPPPSLNLDSSPPKKSPTATTTTTTSNISYGRYSGFHTADYYDDYYQQDYTAYSGKTPNLLAKNDSQPLWCCLLPWMNHQQHIDDAKEEQPQQQQQKNQAKETLVDVNTTPPSSTIASSASKEEDDRSTGSDAFGERLSDKDRQAVLARLRLAQPDEVTNGDNQNTTDNGDTTSASPGESDLNLAKKGLLNGISLPPPQAETSSAPADVSAAPSDEAEAASNGATPRKVPRGILRQNSRMSRNNLLNSAVSQQASGDAKKRRSLFPSYSETTSKKKDVNVSFSPMARVLSVKSHKEMEEDEKGGIWWQKSDYEEFRKTGRMITKAMLEGGSEIWLATNRSWQVPNQARSTTLKHATSLSERQAAKSKGKTNAKKDYENTRDKWWHKFGHSRRGLEHIASIDEGRQRQQNVRRAIRAVVEENRRQNAFLRVDGDKLRMVSLQHTSWARDLAMAAGASDADAVDTNFNDESRKSREFYLLKFSRAQSKSTTTPTRTTKTAKTVPAFMRPATSLQVEPNRLDANTMSQIRYRRKVAPNTSTTTQPRRSSTRMPVKDAAGAAANSMAKQAAGFASGEEVANMSAVLTGMGPLPKNATMVGSG